MTESTRVTTQPNTPQVKICGLTDPEQAGRCAELGADAIGFVFFPKSPRHLEEDRAREIRAALPDGIATVGVFVNEDESFILHKVERCGLTVAQLHGKEPPDMAARLRDRGLVVIKALFGAREPSFAAAPDYAGAVDGFLVEYGAGPLPGGNAEIWNYGSAAGLADRLPLVLAGGLSPENVAEAIAGVKPDAVDVSSGVEASPGVKDMDKVRRFLETVRSGPYPHQPRRVFT